MNLEATATSTNSGPVLIEDCWGKSSPETMVLTKPCFGAFRLHPAPNKNMDPAHLALQVNAPDTVGFFEGGPTYAPRHPRRVFYTRQLWDAPLFIHQRGIEKTPGKKLGKMMENDGTMMENDGK